MVLPFASLSGDPKQEYFADGIVEEIITALSRIRWLFVIARNSTFTYKGQPVDVKRVSRRRGLRPMISSDVRFRVALTTGESTERCAQAIGISEVAARIGAGRLTFLNSIALALTIPGTDTAELRDCIDRGPAAPQPARHEQ